MQVSDDIYLGNAETGIAGPDSAGNPGGRGVGPMARVYIFDLVPLTLQTAGLAALQTLGGAGNFVLSAGTGVTTEVDSQGRTLYVLDCERCLTATVAGVDLSGVTLTFTGYDMYGQLQSEAIAGPNNNTVATAKSFKKLLSVAASGAIGTNTSIGFNNKFGLPFRVTNAAYVVSAKWDSTLADNAGTFAAADTATASPTSGSVRGAFTPAGNAADGTRRLVMALALPAAASGPNATRAGALGNLQSF
jgi:hypothetical protein